MKFSIIIPARNEAAFIGKGLAAIRRAAAGYPGEVETIVVINRCTDDTERMAVEAGAVIVREEARNLSVIRNAGARRATGEILLTIDADSVMSDNMLREIDRAIGSGRFIGGGVPIHPERMSLGIFLTALVIGLMVLPSGISAGLFWCRRSDFEAVGGFDATKTIAEDIDFAQRLKALGATRGLKYGTLWRARIITSCRKFDRWGDWFSLRLLARHPIRCLRAWRGNEQEFADRIFYDFER